MERVLINTSVTRFAACLYAFNRMIDRTRATRGSDAFLYSDFAKEEVERFAALAESVDPLAFATGMWRNEIPGLRNGEP
jgi:hypothetical protein